MQKTNAFLSELDQCVSGGKTLDWDAGDLQSGSAQFAAIPRLVDPDADDHTDQILLRFQDGLPTLETSAERPQGYSDLALQRAKELTTVLDDSVTKLTYAVSRNGDVTGPLPLTQRVAANVDDILGSARVSLGSVEGTVEILSGISEYFTIVDRITGRKIRCECDRATLADLAANHWEKNVVVTGEITEDRSGHPKTMKVRRYRPLKDQKDLPQPEDLLGLYKIPNNG